MRRDSTALRGTSVRADHRSPAGPGPARCDRAADHHLAGLQLLRPQRRRVRRHVVLTLLAQAHRPQPPPSPEGVPERFRSYEVQFLHWLASRGHAVDTYSDEDIELFASPEVLRASYDLIVFPGHTEYVTPRLYDLTRGYRDLGGRLIFLSANNFFRHVKRTGDLARLIGEWRDEGKPESALSATSTSRTTAASGRSRSRSRVPTWLPGCSPARGSRTARSSASTASRSTPPHRARRPAPRCSPRSRISLGRGGRRR